MNEGYDFIKRTKNLPHDKNPKCLICTHLYKFKTYNNTKYIVLAEEHKNDIFAIKFYKQSHSNSKKKYILMTNDFDARRIIMTCVKIGISIYESNKLASFVFLGSPTIPELKKEKKEEKFKNTKRFMVYKNFASFYFSPNNFEHLYDENKSSYFILNREKKKQIPNFEKITEKMFNDYYLLEDLFRQMEALVL